MRSMTAGISGAEAWAAGRGDGMALLLSGVAALPGRARRRDALIVAINIAPRPIHLAPGRT
jgi:hypothetical protein